MKATIKRLDRADFDGVAYQITCVFTRGDIAGMDVPGGAGSSGERLAAEVRRQLRNRANALIDSLEYGGEERQATDGKEKKQEGTGGKEA